MFLHTRARGPSLAHRGPCSLVHEAIKTRVMSAPIVAAGTVNIRACRKVPHAVCRCASSTQLQQPSGQQPEDHSSRHKHNRRRPGPTWISSHGHESVEIDSRDATEQAGAYRAARLPQQQQQQKQQQQQQQQQQQPLAPAELVEHDLALPDQCDDPLSSCANIEYTVSSSVGSYTDPVTCSLSYDGVSSNGHNGGGKQHPLATGGTSHSDADAVRGLVYGATVRFSDSAALRLRRRAMVVWEQRGPKRVLLVKKPVPAAAAVLLEMACWLEGHGLQVFVEPSVHQSEFPQFTPFCPNSTAVDFAITLGGDGTVLHLASLFEEDAPLPPVMCFAMGTLGFLTPFDAAVYRTCLERVLDANRQPLYCTLRTRKRCVVLDSAGHQLRVHHILNECVVDRGACPSSVHLEIYVDGGFVTVAEADGLIVATPSGSTAYSMSAGGSMVAPSVPCTLLTPLSPHSLSFRPLIVPENADLLIRLPEHSRSHARASFDGKHPMRVERGGSIHFTTSLCPLPLINTGTLDTDWYEGITHKLKWNQRIRSVNPQDSATTRSQGVVVSL